LSQDQGHVGCARDGRFGLPPLACLSPHDARPAGKTDRDEFEPQQGGVAAALRHRLPGKAGVNAVTVVSLFAATLSMVSFIPQAWAVVRSRNTDGISLKMYLITVVGFVAWLAYGVLLMQWAIIVQNVICLCLSSFIPVLCSNCH